MKNGRSDPSVCGSRLPGLELLGGRQQPEFVQAWERGKTRTAIRVWGVREPLPEQDGAVEMWGHDAVPACQVKQVKVDALRVRVSCMRLAIIISTISGGK